MELSREKGKGNTPWGWEWVREGKGIKLWSWQREQSTLWGLFIVRAFKGGDFRGGSRAASQ